MEESDNFQRNSSDYSHLDIQHFNPKAFIRLVKISDIRENWWGCEILYIMPDVMSFEYRTVRVWFLRWQNQEQKNNKGVLGPMRRICLELTIILLLLILPHIWVKKLGAAYHHLLLLPRDMWEQEQSRFLTSHLKFRAGLCDWRSQRHTA